LFIWIEIRTIGGQVRHLDLPLAFCQVALHRLAAMIGGVVLNCDDRAACVGAQSFQKLYKP
jgi:hypothetical protein